LQLKDKFEDAKAECVKAVEFRDRRLHQTPKEFVVLEDYLEEHKDDKDFVPPTNDEYVYEMIDGTKTKGVIVRTGKKGHFPIEASTGSTIAHESMVDDGTHSLSADQVSNKYKILDSSLAASEKKKNLHIREASKTLSVDDVMGILRSAKGASFEEEADDAHLDEENEESEEEDEDIAESDSSDDDSDKEKPQKSNALAMLGLDGRSSGSTTAPSADSKSLNSNSSVASASKSRTGVARGALGDAIRTAASRPRTVPATAAARRDGITNARAIAAMDGRGNRLKQSADAELASIKDSMPSAMPTVVYSGNEADTGDKALFEKDLKRSSKDLNSFISKIKNISTKLEASPNKKFFEGILKELEVAGATAMSQVVLNKLVILRTIVPDHYIEQYDAVSRGSSFVGQPPKGLFRVALLRAKVDKAFQLAEYNKIANLLKAGSDHMNDLTEAFATLGDSSGQAKSAASRMVEDLVLTLARASKPMDGGNNESLESCLLALCRLQLNIDDSTTEAMLLFTPLTNAKGAKEADLQASLSTLDNAMDLAPSADGSTLNAILKFLKDHAVGKLFVDIARQVVESKQANKGATEALSAFKQLQGDLPMRLKEGYTGKPAEGYFAEAILACDAVRDLKNPAGKKLKLDDAQKAEYAALKVSFSEKVQATVMELASQATKARLNKTIGFLQFDGISVLREKVQERGFVHA
jgi:hypothetical protein